MNVKQVIVMRKDLKVRRGKEIAQGAHASSAWLTERIAKAKKFGHHTTHSIQVQDIEFTEDEMAWMGGRFTKVCVQVENEKELRTIFGKAKAAGLNAHLITDAGLTEFKGVPTVTCVGIGPNKADEIDVVTGELKLY